MVCLWYCCFNYSDVIFDILIGVGIQFMVIIKKLMVVKFYGEGDLKFVGVIGFCCQVMSVVFIVVIINVIMMNLVI